jgi:acetylornithine deacetylase/succinyl-diaminopimelate desuccinylase-like protein
LLTAAGFEARQLGVEGAPPAVYGELAGEGDASLLLYNHQRHVGVPGLSAPDNPVYGGSAAHAPNEHVRVEDFAPAIEFTIAVLDELGAGGR